MAEKIVNIGELVQDDKNFNKGTTKGKKLMDKSLRTFGAGRSILVDKDMRIIAGNKTQQAAIAAGIKKVKVIKAEKDELVAIQRDDIALDSREGREMALADNATAAANLAWDEDALARAQAETELVAEDWGVALGKKQDDTYSRKIERPTYEPSGTCPALSTCYDTTKKDELMARIEQADVPDEVREFLRCAAFRHVKFNYGLVADYYCHAPKEVQRLFEESALVVIDFNDAIGGLCKTYRGADERIRTGIWRGLT